MSFFKYKAVKSLPTVRDAYRDAEQEAVRLAQEADSLVAELRAKQQAYGIAIADFRIEGCEASSFAEREEIEKWFRSWVDRRNRNQAAHSAALSRWAGLKDELERREKVSLGLK